MSLDRATVSAANEALWKAHPELGGRQLTTGSPDAALRHEWMQAYEAEVTKKPPPPAAVPAPAVPPAPAAPVVACGAAPPPPPPVNVGDCKAVKLQVQEGDIVLRGQRGDNESEFIGKVSGCDYSHAGIVARDESGDLVVVDAYPGRGPVEHTKKTNVRTNTDAVEAHPVDEFFCGNTDHRPTHGLVARPKDSAKAQQAAQWAIDQTSNPEYRFNLWNPWDKSPKQVYCSDFVYQCFQNAGLDIVPDKTDFLDATHRATTLAEARKMDFLAMLATDEAIETDLRRRTGGSSEYITPCQVAVNPETQVTAFYESPAAAMGKGVKKSGR